MSQRCGWCTADPLYLRYHDEEWGVPVHDDQRLFEMLVLEGAQAGLSWLTILKKRENYRKAFDRFGPAVVARYDDGKVDALLADPGIVRNRKKIEAAIRNARCVLRIQEEWGSFDKFIWSFVDGEPIQNIWASLTEVPSRSPASDRMAAELKRRGFQFVGTTICHAFMQAVGMVNDHEISCFRHRQIREIPVV